MTCPCRESHRPERVAIDGELHPEHEGRICMVPLYWGSKHDADCGCPDEVCFGEGQSWQTSEERAKNRIPLASVGPHIEGPSDGFMNDDGSYPR